MTPRYILILRSFSKVTTSPREDSSDDFSEEEFQQWLARIELGTIGIELDFIDNPNFVRECSKDEILKTLHYITSKLNDLPSWLEPLFNAYQQDVIDFILKEVKRKLEASR